MCGIDFQLKCEIYNYTWAFKRFGSRKYFEYFFLFQEINR